VQPQKWKILISICPNFNLNRSISSETILKKGLKCKIPNLLFFQHLQHDVIIITKKDNENILII